MQQDNQAQPDQYNLDDVLADAVETPSAQSPAVAGTAVPEEPPSPSPRPRDPETGRFQKPDEQPQRFTHPNYLVRQAAELGISDEEMQTTPSDMLGDLVYHLGRQALKLTRDHSVQSTLQSATERQQTPGVPPGTPGPPAEPELLALGEEYDPKIRQLADLVRSQGETIRQLQGRLDEVHGVQQAAIHRSVTERVDGFFTQHTAVYGEGNFEQAKKKYGENSPQMKRRNAAADLVRSLGKEPGTLEEKLAKAHAELFSFQEQPPPATPESQRNGLPTREQQWNGGALARPTQRGSTHEPPGERKAVQTAARLMREQGLLDDAAPDGAFPE